MSELVRELRRKRHEELRLQKQSPETVFQETENGKQYNLPEEVVKAINNLVGAVTLAAGSNVNISIVGNTITITATDTGATTFLQLTDTPGTYIGEQGRFVRVNSTEDGLEFVDAPSGTGSSTFTGLTDTPAAYTGQAGKVPAVNAGETALEFTEMDAEKIQGITVDITGLADGYIVYYDGASGTFKVKLDEGGGGWAFGFILLTNEISTADYV